MRRIWTSVSSGVVLVAMVVMVCATPVDFVVWTPGQVTDLLGSDGAQPLIEISGGRTHAVTGQILATSMDQTSQTSQVTLPQVIANYLYPNHAVFPRDAVYSPGRTATETTESRRQDIQSSREQAIASGVRQAGIDVVERPKLLAVRQNGPSYNILFPGDFILAIDNVSMSTPSDIPQYIRNNKQVGDQVVVTVFRPGAGEAQTVTIPKLAGSSTDGTVPTMGTTPGTGYLYSPEITLSMDVDQGDPSQGLALALATYDLLTDSDGTAGQTVAATGAISFAGDVSAVSGINEHAASAWRAHATMLVIPQANCSDITGQFPGMDIVPVATLEDAVNAVHNHSLGTELPRC